MKTTTLEIIDEVNIRFHNLDIHTRNKIYKELEYMVPYAHNLPSYKLGRWDGKKSFANRGGCTALNLLDRVLPIVQKSGYDVQIEDNRGDYGFSFPQIDENLLAEYAWPEGHQQAGEPIILKDHQVKSIQMYTENLQCIQEISTAAGKTIITSALSKLCEPYGRTIIIVPNRDLVTQTEADYLNLGLDVGVFFGGRREWNRKHTICTWQSLNAVEKTEMDKKKDGVEPLSKEQIGEFLKDVVCVIVDEAHSVRGDVLKKLLMGPFANCPIRWGLSGTIPRDDWEFLNLLSSIGPVINTISAKELQDKDILADCHVNVMQLQEVAEFRKYPEELKFLLEDKRRLEFIGSMIAEIAEGGNTLVLVQQIKAGEILTDCIPNSVFVNGSTKSEHRKEEYLAINTEDNKIIVATYGVASTGINIPRIFNLVIIEPGKSFIRTIQSIGRGLRRARDKDFVQVYDVCASTKYSKRHLTERKKFYKHAQYPCKVNKINYL